MDLPWDPHVGPVFTWVQIRILRHRQFRVISVHFSFSSSHYSRFLGDTILIRCHVSFGAAGMRNGDLRALLELVDHNKLIPPGVFFPEFGQYVGEGDWMHLVFTDEGDLEPSFWQSMDNEKIWRHTTIRIDNVDGAFWLIHSRDRSVLEIVCDHMRSLPEFDCEPVYPIGWRI